MITRVKGHDDESLLSARFSYHFFTFFTKRHTRNATSIEMQGVKWEVRRYSEIAEKKKRRTLIVLT